MEVDEHHISQQKIQIKSDCNTIRQCSLTRITLSSVVMLCIAKPIKNQFQWCGCEFCFYILFFEAQNSIKDEYYRDQIV